MMTQISSPVSVFSGLCLSLAMMFAPQTGAAQDSETMRFTASVLGVTAGKMTLGVNRNGADYAVTAKTTSAGMGGMFRSFSVTNKVRGTEQDGRFRPQRYQSTAEGARAGRSAEMVYKGGVPQIVTLEADHHKDAPVLDPSKQGGTIDPLTLTYALLRDVGRDAACNWKLRVFDGHRLAQVTLGAPQDQGEGVSCNGVYRRVDGYPPSELAERQDFPFTVTYATLPDGRLRVTEVTLDSLFGLARLTRDD